MEEKSEALMVHLSNQTPRSLRQALGRDEAFIGRFDLPLEEGEVYLERTSPMVEGLASWTLDQALDPVAREAQPVAARCGAISTRAVSVRTTLLVVRFRYQMKTAGAESETLLSEEILPLACAGAPEQPKWLAPEEAEKLLAARPDRNLLATAIEQQLGILLPALPKLQSTLVSIAEQRAAAQLAAHERVREAARAKGRVTIHPVLPADLLGAYVLLPALS